MQGIQPLLDRAFVAVLHGNFIGRQTIFHNLLVLRCTANRQKCDHDHTQRNADKPEETMPVVIAHFTKHK